MNDTRKESRMQVSLVTRYREPSMAEPREGECRDISPSGMFIMTPRPSPRGALIRFECATDVTHGDFRGTGRVVWQRNKSDPRGPAGMGVRFVRLEPGGREAVARLVELARIERGRNQSDLDRRTSSRPPPRARTTKTISQPFAAAAASPEPKPAEGSSRPLRHSPTLRGVSIHPPPVNVSAAPGRPSSTPPPGRRTIISSSPHDDARAGSNPPRATQRYSPRPPPLASPLPPAPRSDRPGVERASPIAQARSIAVGAASPRDPVAEPKRGSGRPLPVTGRSSQNDRADTQDSGSSERSTSDRPRGDRARDSDRPPSRGVTDDLRDHGHRSRAAGRSSSSGGAAPQEPWATNRAEGPAAASGQPLWLGDGERRRGSSRWIPWTIMGSGVLVSLLLIKLYGSAPVGVPIALKTDEPQAPSSAPSPEPPTVPGSEPVRPIVTAVAPSAAPPPPAPAAVAASGASAVTAKPTGPVAKPVAPTPAVAVAVAASPASTSAVKPESAANKPRTKAGATQSPPAPRAPSTGEAAHAVAATTPSLAPPKAVAASEPQTTTAPQQTPLQQALQCLAQGDNDCVLSALEGKASSERELELLIATYRAMGALPKAEREMQRYLDRFPAGTRAQTYKRLLERRNAEPTPEPHASPEKPTEPPH